jgi:signal transduction histidine kinase/ActR/RegA family two-component response regulator
MVPLIVNLRLRTKFLVSLVLIIGALSSASLIGIHHAVVENMRRQSIIDTQNSLAVFGILRHQHQEALSRKADLLATLATLSESDGDEFKQSVENPLESSGEDLMVLASASGKVLALHSTHSDFTPESAEQLLQVSLRRGTRSDWWLSHGRLYQVELQAIANDSSASRDAASGNVIVGQEISESSLQDLKHLLSGEVAFSCQGKILISTLYPFQENELAAQLRGKNTSDRVHLGPDRFFANTVELTPGIPDGVSLTVLKSDSAMMAFLSQLNHVFFGLGIIAVLGGGCLVFLISDTFTVPLHRLAGGVRALEQGDFEYELKPVGDDEVAQVTRAFDRMRSTLQENAAEKQLLEDQLRQSQKMEALGRLAGGVAHDFNNLLTIIKGHSDLLADSVNVSEPRHRSCSQISKAADRAAGLTRQLLIFSRQQVLQPKLLELNALVAEMDKLLERLVREDIEHELVPGVEPGRIKADPGQVEQVLLNLVVNSCDAMPKGGKLRIQTELVSLGENDGRSRPGVPAGEYVVLSVSDTGCGMDAATRARVFEPFFTTKESGKGTGLGLATVYGIVKQSGGFIWLDSEVGKGTRFEIYFPRVSEKETIAAPQGIAIQEARNRATLLVVEDEPAVRELTSAFLSSAGYKVVTARDGLEAVEIAQKMGTSLDGVLTDVVMPHMRGPELAEQVLQFMPGTRIIFMSGYPQHSEANPGAGKKEFFVQKPFTRESLVLAVSQAMNSRPVRTGPYFSTSDKTI